MSNYQQKQLDLIIAALANGKTIEELVELNMITNMSTFIPLNDGTPDAKRIRIDKLRGALGAWNALTNTPALSNGTGTPNDSYIASTSGTVNFGAGDIIIKAGDKIEYDGAVWRNRSSNREPFIKLAKDFGFLPENNADENSSALQAAVQYGGTIVVDKAGVYDLNHSISLESDTTLIFEAGVTIRKVSFNGSTARHVFYNEGAFTRTYNENIRIVGLKLEVNGIDLGTDITPISEIYGQCYFFYIKNLQIENFTCLDVGLETFCIMCITFENIILEKIHIEGGKDGIHLGNGTKFVIRDYIAKTYDDPIALNAHSYVTAAPEIGWLEDGLIENCYDLNDTTTTGYFCRLLAGAWKDWESGLAIRQGDAVVSSNGKLYRAIGMVGAADLTSTIEPTHSSGVVVHNGINWKMFQENGVGYTAGCRRISFKNIHLQKERDVVFSFHFDDDIYSRSYYPNAISPVQEDISFENIYQSNTAFRFIHARTPVNSININKAIFEDEYIHFEALPTVGISYVATKLVMDNILFKGNATQTLVQSLDDAVDVKLTGVKLDAGYIPTFPGANLTYLNLDGIKATTLEAIGLLKANTSGASSQFMAGAPTAGYPGIWFGANASSPSFSNYAFIYDAGNGVAVNAKSGEHIFFRVNNVNAAKVDGATGHFDLYSHKIVNLAAGTAAGDAVNKGQLDAAARPYKIYSARISQSGTAAPIVDVLENTLSAAITWTRTSAGIYNGALTGEFTSAKTLVFLTNGIGGTPTMFNAYALNVNDIAIYTYNSSGTLADARLSSASIEIRVYP